MEELISTLKEEYKIFAPKRFPGGVIRYGEIDSFGEVVTEEKSQFSPKEIYLPIVQTILCFRDNECIESELSDDKKIIILARACDINAIEKLDTIFLRNGSQEDMYYKRLREKVRFVLLECAEGFDSCFCVSMGTNAAEGFTGVFRDGKIDMQASPVFPEANRKAVAVPEIDEALVKDITELEFWNSFDERCISCGGCNAVCPTCSCFDTIDVIYSETSLDGERRRVWGSCMREDFSTMAGGHSVRKTPGERMRFKAMHKVYDFNKRFGGGQMCVGCGRCEDRCPKDIVFSDTINTLSAETLRLKKEGGRDK